MCVFFSGTGNSDVLKQAAVPVVSRKSCSQSYAKIMNITNSVVCAGYVQGGHDSCQVSIQLCNTEVIIYI